MRRARQLAAICAAAVCLGLPGAAADESGAAQARFDEAQHLLNRADAARDGGDLRASTDLYRQALERYLGLAKTAPDLQPAVVRFRITYCDDQLNALLDQTPRVDVSVAPGPRGAAPPAGDAAALSAAASTNAATVPASEPDTAPAPLPRTPAPANDAVRLLVEGQADKATRLLLDALKADPDNARVRLLIGIAQCRNERYEDAIFVLEQLAEELPADAWVRTALGTAFFGAGLVDRAAGELRRALAIRPELAEAHFDLAQVLLAGDPPDLDAARRHYDRARELGLESDPATEHALQPAPEPPAPGGGQ